MWNFEHEIMFNRIPQSALRRKDQMSHKRSVMSNKWNAVMSVIHVIWFQDVSLAQRRRNPTIARRDIYIYMSVYMFSYIYIYVYIHNLILCQNECQMSACGHALFVQRFMYTCICMHVCSFLLKRSMYDYNRWWSWTVPGPGEPGFWYFGPTRTTMTCNDMQRQHDGWWWWGWWWW